MTASAGKKRRRLGRVLGIATAVLVALLAATWLLGRPGVFIIQPIGAVPDGVTILYHSRGDKMPFFASADGVCLEMQGGVSLLCRGIALKQVTDAIEDNVIARLPYSEWAYLQSTGGAQFDK